MIHNLLNDETLSVSCEPLIDLDLWWPTCVSKMIRYYLLKIWKQWT